MKADVCEILAHETCSESTKERCWACVFTGGARQGARSVCLSLIVESSDLLPTFAFLDLRHLGKEWLISSDY